MDEVQGIINEIETNPVIEAAVLISGKPGCFIAGADISMIELCKTKEEVVGLAKSGKLDCLILLYINFQPFSLLCFLNVNWYVYLSFEYHPC